MAVLTDTQDLSDIAQQTQDQREPPDTRKAEDSVLEERRAVGRKQAEDIEARGAAKAEAVPALKGAMGKLEATAAQVPETPDLPKPPDMKRHPFLEGPGKPADTIKEFLQALSILAGPIGGLIGKSGIVASSAMNGAMKGWMQGDDARVQREMDQWKAATDHVLQTATSQQEHYKAILESSKISFEMKRQAYALAGAEFEDKIAADASKAEGLDSILKFMEDRQKHIDALQTHRDTLWMQYENHKDMQTFREQQAKDKEKQHKEDLEEREKYHAGMLKKGEGGGGSGDTMTDEELDALARKSLMPGGKDPSFGMSGKDPLRKRYLKRLAQLSVQPGNTPEDVATKKAAFHAITVRLNKLEQQYAQVSPFEKTARANLQLAVQKSKAVPRSDFTAINKALIAGERMSGSSPAAEFESAALVAANEVARVTTSLTGVSSDTARREAREVLATALSQGQFEGVVNNVLSKDMDSRIKGLKDDIAEAREMLKTTAGGQTGGGKSTESSPAPEGTRIKVGKKFQVKKNGAWVDE
jgi:hypothetical protein